MSWRRPLAEGIRLPCQLCSASAHSSARGRPAWTQPGSRSDQPPGPPLCQSSWTGTAVTFTISSSTLRRRELPHGLPDHSMSGLAESISCRTRLTPALHATEVSGSKSTGMTSSRLRRVVRCEAPGVVHSAGAGKLPDDATADARAGQRDDASGQAFTTAVARRGLSRYRPDPGPSRGGGCSSKSRLVHVRYLR